MKSKEECFEEIRSFDYDILQLEEIHRAMEEYASQFKREWVSVEDERKPKQFQQVLAASSEGRIVKVDFVNGEFDDYNLTNSDHGERITHWMPLPEQPKEEQ